MTTFLVSEKSAENVAKTNGHDETTYICLVCQRVFHKDAIHMHLNLKHHESKVTAVTAEPSLEDYTMPKDITTAEEDEEEETPKKRDNKCPMCGKILPTEKGLLIHVAKSHGRDKLSKLNKHPAECKDGKCKLPKKSETPKEASSAIPLIQDAPAHETHPEPQKAECPVCHGMYRKGGIKLHMTKAHKAYKVEASQKPRGEVLDEMETQKQWEESEEGRAQAALEAAKTVLDAPKEEQARNDTLGAVFGQEAADVFAQAANRGEGFAKEAAKKLTEMYPNKQVKDITLEEFVKVLETLVDAAPRPTPESTFIEYLRTAAAKDMEGLGFDAEKVAADLEAKTAGAKRRYTAKRSMGDIEDEVTMRTLRTQHAALNETLGVFSQEICDAETRLNALRGEHKQVVDRMLFIDEIIEKTYEERESDGGALLSPFAMSTLLLGPLVANMLGKGLDEMIRGMKQ